MDQWILASTQTLVQFIADEMKGACRMNFWNTGVSPEGSESLHALAASRVRWGVAETL